MGRTLPPLFRTVRRVCRILQRRGLLPNSAKVQNWRVLQNSVEGSIFVIQISVKQKRTFLQISVKTFIFCLADFCGTKLRGWLWLSFFGLSPLSVCGFLLICSFWPIKRKLPLLSPVSVLWLCLLPFRCP